MYLQADVQARDVSQKSDCMEEAARIISKAFSSCVTDRLRPFFPRVDAPVNTVVEHPLIRCQGSGAYTMLLA